MVARKNNPDYSQVSGYIQGDLLNSFRGYCDRNNLQISEGLENALRLWLENPEKQAVAPIEKFLHKLIAGERTTASEMIEVSHLLGVTVKDLLSICVNVSVANFLKSLTQNEPPTDPEIAELAHLLEVTTEDLFLICLNNSVGHFLKKLCRKERPDESEIVLLAHELGVKMSELSNVVDLVTTRRSNGEKSNGRNGN